MILIQIEEHFRKDICFRKRCIITLAMSDARFRCGQLYVYNFTGRGRHWCDSELKRYNRRLALRPHWVHYMGKMHILKYIIIKIFYRLWGTYQKCENMTIEKFALLDMYTYMTPILSPNLIVLAPFPKQIDNNIAPSLSSPLKWGGVRHKDQGRYASGFWPPSFFNLAPFSFFTSTIFLAQFSYD